MKTKLQKQLEYTDKDNRQYKHIIVIPEEAVHELGWSDGQHLELTITEWRLIIEAKEWAISQFVINIEFHNNHFEFICFEVLLKGLSYYDILDRR